MVCTAIDERKKRKKKREEEKRKERAKGLFNSPTLSLLFQVKFDDFKHL